MEAIPKIAFRKHSKPGLDFEIFSFRSLFDRRARVPVPLDIPQRLNFYLILIITEGSGSHFIDFREFTFHEGCILFVSKGQVHAFEVEADRDGFLVLFTEDFLSRNLIHSATPTLSRLYNYHLYSPILHPAEIGGVDLLAIVNTMHEEYNAPDDASKEEILQLLLRLLLLKIERIRRGLVPQEKHVPWFARFDMFRGLLQAHFAETRNARQYADMMKVSYKYLNQICKAVTGRTAKEFVDDFIVLEIKRYLAATDLSIKELTYELGFDEPTNFVKFFKRYTRQSPSQFRKTLTK